MKKILFISHDAHRAGAQLILLELLRYFKKNSQNKFEILLKNGGELLPEFEYTAKTYLWNKTRRSASLFRRYYNFKEKRRKEDIIDHLKEQNFNLIYSNTITNGDLLNILSCLNIPVITHVHELKYWIEKYGQQNLEYIKTHTRKYIAVSEAVKLNLIGNYNIPSDSVELIHEFTDYEKINKEQAVKGLRKLLKISDNCIIVGACGREAWRKGKDLFIPLAIQTLEDVKKDVHFLWIGGEMTYELQFDLEKSGLGDKIHFIDHLPEASKYFNDFDIFLMLSREDPFPIVNLEVAALAKPILCFNNSGGSPELLSSINGIVSGYLNLQEMSEKIINLTNDSEQCTEIGGRLSEKVKNQFNIDIIAAKIEILIDQL